MEGQQWQIANVADSFTSFGGVMRLRQELLCCDIQ